LNKLIDAVFQNQGEKLVLDVSKPFLANDPSMVWFISKGSINLSGTKVIGGEAIGKIQDFSTLKSGQAFFGIRRKDYNSLCFLASPQEETVLYR